MSLLTIALISIPFCFFTLGQLVSWLIQVQILLRFIWQCAAVILLRRYRPDIPQPFTMWLYPWPAAPLGRAVALHLLHRPVGGDRVLVRFLARDRAYGLCGVATRSLGARRSPAVRESGRLPERQQIRQ